eukprot:jgi/Botrbrau1/17076/Bobra.0285s0003.1
MGLPTATLRQCWPMLANRFSKGSPHGGPGPQGTWAHRVGASNELGDLAERLRKEAEEAERDAQNTGSQGREGGEAGWEGSMGVTALLSRAWQFGPQRSGPNVLLVGTGPGSGLWDVPPRLLERITKRGGPSQPMGAAGPNGRPEPPEAGHADQAEETYGPFTGQVTSAARQAIRRAVLEAGARLVEAMFLCEVATSAEALSGVYSVLSKRRAQIVKEDLREGSTLFSVHAFLPAASSFELAGDMRALSSGEASPSLMLSHWQRLQEEREEWGEEGQGVGAGNLARALINEVRARKGLPVDRKVVESATKQRNRARKV